ncbi:hypothetical protein PL75_05040 [Neisseria arctica]|uniref:Uncharacterized protein n=1 Tax=Neisseria arctica TaxID=1470200 RepID=A0A0J1C431_9NEIS|nr:hypothetical protein [Neisseria arctica]KLT73043.1 hypothetical protein PL75_05040 [Neisseria arctica]UOO86759.1 hypothetical protein LVJ86_00425 [Neisseria arctica]
MHLTLALPALCRDGLENAGGLDLPALNSLLRFGKFTAHSALPSEFYAKYLWRGSLLTAAKQSLGLDVGQAAVFASPVWQQMGMHHMDMLGGGAVGISEAESAELIADLNAFYQADGWCFYALRPDWWLLTLPQEPDWCVAPLPDALGQNDGTVRAEGKDAAQWLQMQTEMQMLLHNHALNNVRAREGLPAINGVWLWQDLAGALPPEYPLLGSDSMWAQFYPGQRLDAPYDLQAWFAYLDEQPVAASHSVLFLDDLSAMRDTGDIWSYQNLLLEWEQRFFAPAYAALQTGRLKSLQIATDGVYGGVLSVAAKPGWAFWKRKKIFSGRLD